LDNISSKEEIMRLKLISKVFKGFADYNRLCIFRCLLEGEKTILMLAKDLVKDISEEKLNCMTY
jgi:hypothetical protein